MPSIVKRSPAAARRIMEALTNIAAETPRNAQLKRRIEAGTLKVNFNTVEIESGVKRHLYDKPASLYAEEHKAIIAAMPAKGSVTPLRKQLDQERRRLQVSEARLQRSRSYAAQLLILMQTKNVEITRLKEEIENGSDDVEQQSIIGSGQVASLPPVKRRVRPTSDRMRGQARPGVGR